MRVLVLRQKSEEGLALISGKARRNCTFMTLRKLILEKYHLFKGYFENDTRDESFERFVGIKSF